MSVPIPQIDPKTVEPQDTAEGTSIATVPGLEFAETLDSQLASDREPDEQDREETSRDSSEQEQEDIASDLLAPATEPVETELAALVVLNSFRPDGDRDRGEVSDLASFVMAGGPSSESGSSQTAPVLDAAPVLNSAPVSDTAPMAAELAAPDVGAGVDGGIGGAAGFSASLDQGMRGMQGDQQAAQVALPIDLSVPDNVRSQLSDVQVASSEPAAPIASTETADQAVPTQTAGPVSQLSPNAPILASVDRVEGATANFADDAAPILPRDERIDAAGPAIASRAEEVEALVGARGATGEARNAELGRIEPQIQNVVSAGSATAHGEETSDRSHSDAQTGGDHRESLRDDTPARSSNPEILDPTLRVATTTIAASPEPVDVPTIAVPAAPVDGLARSLAPAGAVGPESATPAGVATPAESIPIHAEWLAARGGGTARIRLHPAELGEIELKVTVQGSRVRVIISAVEPAAQAVAQEYGQMLGDRLAARELQMDHFEVRSLPREDPSETGREHARESGERNREQARNGSQHATRFGVTLENPAQLSGGTLAGFTASGVDLRV